MRYLITLIITMIYAVTATAQAIERPKIGLVLSGGGAKGLAHVGVLKAIDEAGLTIDYISGTSMGAIIAAMYAAGYSGEEIEEASRNIDWTSLMSGSVDFLDISIEEKENYENYSINVPLKGFKMSPFTGVKEPQEVMLKFAEVFFPVYKTKKFDQLDIPFRCIAADLSNGDAVVIKEGDLAFAVRSSMAIPGVFEATNYGETKLVDGGIVRNFPVRDVKDMGADFVIGVNLFSGLYEPHDLTTAVDVLMQIANFRDANDLIDEKRQCDMVIEPDVTDYSAASFGSSDKILAIGDSVGKDFYPLFKQLADSLHNHYGLEYSTKERLPQYSDSVVIKSFDIVGLSNTTQDLLMHNLNLKIGESYTVQQLNDAFRKAYSSQYYTNLTYELIPLDDENGVSLKCNVEEYPLSSLKIGLSYNTFTNASLILGYSHKNLTGERSTIDFKVALSESFRFKIGNKLYFGDKYNHHFDAYYDFSMFEMPIYKSNHKTHVYDYRRNDLAIQVGHIFSKKSEMLVKIGYESLSISPDVSEISDKNDTIKIQREILDGKIKNTYFNLKYHYNTLNRKQLPQKGISFETNLNVAIKPKYNFENTSDSIMNTIKDRNTIFRLKSELSMYQQINERSSVIEHISLVTSYGKQTEVQKTALGGCNKFLPNHVSFYGLTTAQMLVESVVAVKVGLQHRIVDELYGILHLNAATTFNRIDDYIEKKYFKEDSYFYGVGATLAYNFSYLPFELTLMYSPDYKFNVSVNVGFLF